MKSKNYCEWCGNKTTLEKIVMPDTPLLEFLEEKIDVLGRDKIWGEDSMWFDMDLEPDEEAELLVYDGLLNSLSQKIICEGCLDEDERIYKQYYKDEINDDEDEY